LSSFDHRQRSSDRRQKGLPGAISRFGLGTFVDPRKEGRKVNARSTEDLVSVIAVGGGAAVLQEGSD
jgi:acyl CoA:acetate/3-ketoacid CoA transferase